MKRGGLIVIFAWMSSQEKHVKNYVDLYSSLGWDSLVCHSQFLNMLVFEILRVSDSFAYFLFLKLFGSAMSGDICSGFGLDFTEFARLLLGIKKVTALVELFA